MKKDVWIINHYAMPPQLPGGTRHYEFATHLVARGYAVTIWLSSFHYSLRQYVDGTMRAKIKNCLPDQLSLCWIWSSSYRDNDWRRIINIFTFTLLLLCRGLFSRRPQTIIASSPHLLAALAGWMLSKVKRSRFILEIRDVWPDSLVVVGIEKRTLMYKLMYRLAHFLYQRGQRIIVLTEGIRDTLVQQGVDEDKVVFLPNGISLDFLQGGDTNDSTRRELGFDDKFVCLYAGAHGPANALETVLEAARLLTCRKEILFVLMGDGPEKEKLQASALEMNLPNLIFLKPVPKSAVYLVLHAANALILSLRKDKMFEGARPNKLFDYLASGRPVICAVDGEARKLVEEVQVGVFARPEDPGNLAEAVSFVYDNRREIGAKAALNGPAYIAEHGNREKMTDLLEKVILESHKVLCKFPAVFIMTSHRWDDPRIFYKQALSLAPRYRVELHAPGAGMPFIKEGVKVFPLPRYSKPYYRPINWLRLLYRGFCTRAEIIHLHDPELLPVGYLLKMLAGKKIIYDVHEDFAATLEKKPWLPACFRNPLARSLGRAEKWFARRVDALVLAEAYYSELFTDGKVQKVGIYNYPLVNLAPEPQKTGTDPVIKLVYAGGITKPRGAVQMIRALKLVDWQSKDYHLNLIGPCQPPALKEELLALAAELGVADKISFAGLIPLTEVYKYYSSADIGLALLHPEKNYVRSLATKIFEYMSAGLPVLASDFPDWTGLVEGNGCGYNVHPLDEQAIAQRLEELLNNPNLCREMGLNGYRAFINKYNWQLEEIKLLSLYEKLLPAKGSNEIV